MISYPRGSSLYLVDGTASHMLPEILAGGLCSLTPGEDRLAISVFFRVDSRTGEFLEDGDNKPRLEKTVIRTSRFSYAQVQRVYNDRGRAGALPKGVTLHGGSTNAADEVLADLHTLKSVTEKMRQFRTRTASGTAEQDDGTEQRRRKPWRARMDRDGFPTEIVFLQEGGAGDNEAHAVIQELMLRANYAVARIQMASPSWGSFAVLRHTPGQNGTSPRLRIDKEKAEKLQQFRKAAEEARRYE